MRVFITGGTGLIGRRLVPKLLERGDQLAVLTRRPDTAQQLWGDKVQAVAGDPVQPGPWQDALAGCDAVVNLAGEGIFKRRWNTAFKELLRSSRIKSTENVVAALARPASAKVLVNASAIGYYGCTGAEELTEAAPPGNDTLARLCVEWERTAQTALTPHPSPSGRGVGGEGCRVAIVRIGVVLDPAGGALAKMLLPFKMFVGGPIGSGKQYVSWIHNEDLTGLFLAALDNAQAIGPINGTAPKPVTNAELSKSLGRALHRPSFMPTPSFALHLALGEVADLVTKGQRVVPAKALELGYKFQFADIEVAFKSLLGRVRAPRKRIDPRQAEEMFRKIFGVGKGEDSGSKRRE